MPLKIAKSFWTISVLRLALQGHCAANGQNDWHPSASMSDHPGASPRSGKALFDATAPFAEEILTRSWWHVGSTLVILVMMLTFAAVAPWWPLRLAASIIGG